MFSHYHGRLEYQEQRGGRGGEANRRQNYDEWNDGWSEYSSWKTWRTSADFPKCDTEHPNEGNLKHQLPSYGYGSADSITGRSEPVSYGVGVSHNDCLTYNDTHYELLQSRAIGCNRETSVHPDGVFDYLADNGCKLERNSSKILDETSQNQTYHNEHLDQYLLGCSKTDKNEKKENLKEPQFWIPGRTQLQEPTYHFNVIYNHAQCPLSRTDGTDLATKITRALVERLELKGYGNSYYHDRDYRPYNSLAKELARVVAGSSVTILLLTPGFLRNCLEHYLDISAFRNLLFNLPAQKRLMVLCVGVARDQIPSQLQHCDILYFNKDWEVDVAAWDRFESVMRDELGPQSLTKWQQRPWETKESNAKPEFDLYEKRISDSTSFERDVDTSFRLFEERTATRSAWLEEDKDTPPKLHDKQTDSNIECEEKRNLSESDLWWAGIRSEELNSQQSSHFMDNTEIEASDLHNFGRSGHKFRVLLGKQVDQISSKTFDDFLPHETTKAKHLNSGVGDESENFVDDIENYSSFIMGDSRLPEDDLDMELLTIKYGSVWDGNDRTPKCDHWKEDLIVQDIMDHCDVWEAANHEIWDKGGQELTETLDCPYGTVKYGKQHQQLCNGSLDSFHSYHATTMKEETGKLYLPDGWTIDEEQESWIMDAISNWSSYDIRDYWALSHMYHWWVPEESIKRSEISEMPDFRTGGITKAENLNDWMTSRVGDTKSRETGQINEWENHNISHSTSMTSQGKNREKEEIKTSTKKQVVSTETKASNRECSHEGKTNPPLPGYESDHNLFAADINSLNDEHLHSATDHIFQHLSHVKTSRKLDSHSHTLSGNEAHDLPSYQIQETTSHFRQPHTTEIQESYVFGTSCDNTSGSVQKGALRKSQDTVVENSQDLVTRLPRNMNVEGLRYQNVEKPSYSDINLVDQQGDNINNDCYSSRQELEVDSRSLSLLAKESQSEKIRDVSNTNLTGKVESAQPKTVDESETKLVENFGNIQVDSEKILSKISFSANNNVSSEPSTRSDHIGTLIANLPQNETVDRNEQTLFQGTDKSVKQFQDNSEINTKVTDVTSKCKVLENPKIKLVTSTTQSSMQIKISVPSITDNIQTTVRLDTSSQSHRIEKKDKDAINLRLGEGGKQSFLGDIHDEGETVQSQEEVLADKKEHTTDNNCNNDNYKSSLQESKYDDVGKTDLQSSPNDCNLNEKQTMLSMDHSSGEQNTKNISKTESALNRVEVDGASRTGDGQLAECIQLSSNKSYEGNDNGHSLSQENQNKDKSFQPEEEVSSSDSVLENLNRNIVANFLSEDMLLANLNTEMNSKWRISKDSDTPGKPHREDYTEIIVSQDLGTDKLTVSTSTDTTMADENQILMSRMMTETADSTTHTGKDSKNATGIDENEISDHAGVNKAETFRTESTLSIICNENALESHENIIHDHTGTRQKENSELEIKTMSKKDPAISNQNEHSNYLEVEDLSPAKQVVYDKKDFINTNESQTHSYPVTDLAKDIENETLPVADNKDEVVSGDKETSCCIKDYNVETQLVTNSKGIDTHWNKTLDCNREPEMQVVTSNQDAVLTNEDHDIGMEHSAAETLEASNKGEVILAMNQTLNEADSKQSSQVETISGERLSAAGASDNQVVMMYENHANKCQPEELNFETNKGIESMALIEEIDFSFSSEEFLEDEIEDNETETEHKDTVGSSVESYETKTLCQHEGNENGKNNFSDDEKTNQHADTIYDNGQKSMAGDYSRNDGGVMSVDERNQDQYMPNDKTHDQQNLSDGEKNEEQNVPGDDEKEESCMTAKVKDEKQNLNEGWDNGEHSLSSSDCTRHEENKFLREKNEKGSEDEIPGGQSVSSELMVPYHEETESIGAEDRDVECKAFSIGNKEGNCQLAIEEANREGEEENQTTEVKLKEHAFDTNELNGSLNFRDSENGGHKLSSGDLEIENQTADIEKSFFVENRQPSSSDDDKPDLEDSVSEKENKDKDDILSGRTMDKNSQLDLNKATSSRIQRQGEGETSTTTSKEKLEHSTNNLIQLMSYSCDLGSSVDGEGPRYSITKKEEPSLLQTSFCGNDIICEIDNIEQKDNNASVTVVTPENENLSSQEVANESDELGTESIIKETDIGTMNNISAQGTDGTLKENINTKTSVSAASNQLCLKNDQPLEYSNKSSYKEETDLDVRNPCNSTDDATSLHSCALYKLLTKCENTSSQNKFPKDELNIIASQMADDMLNNQIKLEISQQLNRKQRDVSHDFDSQDGCESKLQVQIVKKKDKQKETTHLTQKERVATVDYVDGGNSFSHASWRSEATDFRDLGVDEEVDVVPNEMPNSKGMESLHSMLHTEHDTIKWSSVCDDNEKKFRAAHGTSVDKEDISRIHAMFCAPGDVSFDSYNSPRSNQFIEGDSGYFGEKSDSFICSEDFPEDIMQRGITMNLRNTISRKNDLGENTETIQTSNVDNHDGRTSSVAGITSVLKDIDSLCLIYGNENFFVSDFDEDKHMYLDHTLADTRFDNSRLQTKEKDTELWEVVERGNKEPFLLPGDSGICKEKRPSFYDESSTFQYNISREVSIYGEGLQGFGRQNKARLYRPWINELIWPTGRRTFQKGSPTALGWNFNAKLTDTPSTPAETILEPDSTESTQVGKDKRPSGETLTDKADTERSGMGKEAATTEDVKAYEEEATGGGGAQSKTQGEEG